MEDDECDSVSLKAPVEGIGVEEVEPVDESVAESSWLSSSTSESNKLFRRFSSLAEDVLCDGKFVVSFGGAGSAAC